MSFNRGTKRNSFGSRNFNRSGGGNGNPTGRNNIGGGIMGGMGGSTGGGGGGGVNPWESGMMPGRGLLPTPNNNLFLSSPQAQLVIASNLLSNLLRTQQEVQPQVPSLLSLGNSLNGPAPNFGGQQNFGPGRFNDRPMRTPMKNQRPQPYNKSRTPLLLGAIILGRIDIARRLLRDGYPINSRSEEDKTTALMWAVRRKDLEMINLLVRNGADLTLLDSNNDNVALIAIQSSSWEQNDFLDFWNSIDRKIDLKHENTSGYTILHYARKRQWDILARLIDRNPSLLTAIDSITRNPCFCCHCSSTSGTTRYRVKQVLPSEYMESTLSHLSFLFDDIVNRYRDTWSRDRDLGYPDFHGGHGDTAATFDDLVSLRREEIARLNTVLPKLEESYLQKLRDCWSSLVAKIRQTALRDTRKFDEFVTSIQIQLLTHQVSPVNDKSVEFYATSVKTTSRKSTEFLDFSMPGNSTRRHNDESSSGKKFNLHAGFTTRDS